VTRSGEESYSSWILPRWRRSAAARPLRGNMGGPNEPARDAGQPRRRPGGNGPGSRPGHHQATNLRLVAMPSAWTEAPPLCGQTAAGRCTARVPARRYQSRNGAINQDPPVANTANGSSESGAGEDRNKITNIGNERSR